jgi:uncharacterized lipoprotein YddW (UPF0748 family)
MKRREFINYFTCSGFMLSQVLYEMNFDVKKSSDLGGIGKNWIWLRPVKQLSRYGFRDELAKLKRLGFDGIHALCYDGRHAYYGNASLPVKEAFLDELLPVAQSLELQVHAWIFTLMCNMDSIMKSHKDWFNVSREQKSSLENPPYVGYYRWLCPSNTEVVQYLKNIVAELSQYSGLKGIHLDYIRYPDVILPKQLQRKYGLIQDQELSQFDFCYCNTCRNSFKSISGMDPLDLKNPQENLQWRVYREQKISEFVSNLAYVIREENKMISAAVFATPRLAKEYVRQDWSNWNLDAVFPMIYHNFYDQELDWIQQATIEGKAALANRMPLFSGIFIPSIAPDKLRSALEYVRAGGAHGVSLFSWNAMTPEHWQVLRDN